MLDGKKTHIAAAGIILTAAGGFLSGEFTLIEALGVGLGGLGFSTLRLGVKKAGDS